MTDATQRHSAVTPPANERRGALSREYPCRLEGYIDEDLHRAISSAARAEKERQFVIVRRWLRLVARQSGYYPQQESI